jgi:hypothetical protein
MADTRNPSDTSTFASSDSFADRGSGMGSSGMGSTGTGSSGMGSSGMGTAGIGSDTGEGYQPASNMGGSGSAGGISGMASKAGDKLMDAAEQQKSVGADFVSGMADAVRNAAGSFDNQLPQAGEYIRYAADHMADMSDALRRRDIRQLVSGVESFARRQPTAFLGATFLAGFAAVRFLRSSSDRSGMGRSGMGPSDMDRSGMGRYGMGGRSYDGERERDDQFGGSSGQSWPQSNTQSNPGM